MIKLLLCILEDTETQIAAIRHVVSQHVEIDLRLAENGRAFLEMLESKRFVPDIVILDINTPPLDGFEVLKVLRGARQFDDMPIVMFTTSTSSQDERTATELGANGFYFKPEVKKLGQQILEIIKRFCPPDKIASKPTEWQPLDKAIGSSGGTSKALSDIDDLLEGLI